ncbi:MAG TPA: DUF4115 domain-containing protein [Bryobacteraceae bacterium]|nr:DUF4115 domain-containing protein [Bryobacteraceae bacterium]
MARLRIRVELNRGGMGVPLHKLARVVDEAQIFFRMLAEDVQVDKSKGEWLGFDFDHESLNFTAEFVGPVTANQVSAFNAAFDGATPLRRTTIAQFARITEAIEEDELIGFGLYLNEDGAEPDEWRCLSRRDALRITEAIQLLAGEFRGPDKESRLPAVASADNGGRLFSERRARSAEAGKLAAFVRDVEANLSKRITRVENKIEDHSGQIQDLRAKSGATEDSMRRLLSAVETFCEKATRQIEAAPGTALPPAPATKSAKSAPWLPPNWKWGWRWAAAAGALVIVGATSGVLLWTSHTVEPAVQAAAKPAPALVPVSKPAPAQPAAAHIDLQASQPVWVSLAGADGSKLISRLFEPGDTRSLDLPDSATLRVGNAGGIDVRLNGTSLGPIGPSGQIREVRFKDGAYKIVDPTSKAAHPAPTSTASAVADP